MTARFKTRCKSCGAPWSLVTAVAAPVVEVQAFDQVEAHVGERINTIAPFDVLLGGIPPGKVVVVLGRKGSGKSTLGLQASAACSSLYVAAEWSKVDAAQKRIELGLVGGLDRLVVETTNTETACSKVRSHAPRIAVVDAWQSMTSTSAPESRYAQMLHFMTSFVGALEEVGAAGILISRVRKDGEFLGHEDLLHGCNGAVLRLVKLAKRRELRIDKTRISRDTPGIVRLVYDDHGLRLVRLKPRADAVDVSPSPPTSSPADASTPTTRQRPRLRAVGPSRTPGPTTARAR